MHSPNFLFPRFLKVSLGAILAIFHIANVFLVGYIIRAKVDGTKCYDIWALLHVCNQYNAESLTR